MKDRRKKNMWGTGWEFLAVAWLLGSPAFGQSPDPTTNSVWHWAQEDEFEKITNLLTWCHDALIERYQAVNVCTTKVHEPSYIWPVRDLIEFAHDVDEIADKYVNHTLATGDDFDPYFEETTGWTWQFVEGIETSGYRWVVARTNEFPMWTRGGLLEYV
ncbi:MAG: hypothetical protein AAF492_30550, partial [Verrucomicrobiota bacterium]